YLKEKIPGLKLVGADPEGSVYADIAETGEPGESGVYQVEGIGNDYLPSTCDLTLLDRVFRIPDRAAFQMARRLAREEGIFAGGSSGANLVAALQIARDLPADAVVVVIIPDTGERYLSKQWNDDWMLHNQMLEEEAELTAAGVVGRRAREVDPLLSVEAETSVHDAIAIMRRHDLSQLPVRQGAELVGCFYENQAIDLLYHRGDLSDLPVREVMGESLPVVPGNTRVEEIATRIARGQKAVLVDCGGEMTILTKFDLIHASAD
ncbi:MAG: pyridoxal-phosphate dependent enzyme, partial [Planctomycetota bacterium]